MSYKTASHRISLCFLVFSALALTLASAAVGDGGITYVDIAADPASGLEFSKQPSSLFDVTQQVREDSLSQPIDFVTRVLSLPAMGGFGMSGAAVWDYDRDGDLDLYVADGPGAANSLFSNQLTETGELRFIDIASAAGVDATEQDSQGVCYGDLDNDGDPDLVVLGRNEANLLFENLGDVDGEVRFEQVEASGVASPETTASSCSLGDVDGDGLLDLVIANSFDLTNHVPLFFTAFDLNQHNQLFRNNGDMTFADVSDSSGVTDNRFKDPVNDGRPGITWGVSMIDVDLDGDLDIFFADDQGAYPESDETFPFPPFEPGTDRGVVHIFMNDGEGNFTDHPILDVEDFHGAYMGFSFGDFNCDGNLDFFVTNFGDYAIALGDPNPPDLGFQASRWFLGEGDGTFTDPGVGDDLVATPFGWGTEAFDYDNDGDQDIVFHGGLDLMAQVSLDNQGTILQNQNCSARFVADQNAVQTDHSRRSVRAFTVGDLNQDGFVDLVVPAEMRVADDVPLHPNPLTFDSPFDETARFARFWQEVEGGDQWTGAANEPGDLVVEISSGNDNGWASITPHGTVGIATGAVNNYDGIGATLFFRPDGGEEVIAPVTGGASYISQSSRERIFGLGSQSHGTLEVLWPGGVRNRLRPVGAGERLIVPEIPCDFESQFEDRDAYRACVDKALEELEDAGVLDEDQSDRFAASAFECRATGKNLCLRDRFEVDVEWTDFRGESGDGRVIPSEAQNGGLFGFFGPNDPEMHVKVLDGCALNGYYWVFAGASTSVAYELSVTDVRTGSVRTYENSLGERATAVDDTAAFPCN